MSTTPIAEEPRHRIESIEEMKESEKTRLSRAYTIWVMMKSTMHQAAKTEQYEEVLKPVATFNTVNKPVSYSL